MSTQAAASDGLFSQSYAEARQKFLEAAELTQHEVQSHLHPLPGRDGEPLAMDVVLVGNPKAKSLLIISSACHGVEGFCGSGAQLQLLRTSPACEILWRRDVVVLLVHALNPYGFSWWRRTTHENIDLNRNFHDFSKPLPANAGYDELASAIVPETWPPAPQDEARLQAFAAAHGERALQAAFSAGQHTHADGLFYGGHAPTWSQQVLRGVLREHGSHCERLGWIDLHTGLGPSGHGERIFACRDDAAALKRARAWWGDEVTSIYDGSSSSALLTGMMWLAAYEECPQAEYTGIALEFGTVPVMQVLDALRADQWLQNHPEAGAAQQATIKRQVRDAFYTDTDAWKRSVIEQAAFAAYAAVLGLGAAD